MMIQRCVHLFVHLNRYLLLTCHPFISVCVSPNDSENLKKCNEKEKLALGENKYQKKVSEFADSIREKHIIDSCSLTHHTLPAKRDVSTHCCFAYENPSAS